MRSRKIILLLLVILLSITLVVGTTGCKGKKSEAVRKKAPRVLEEEPYDPCGKAAEESAEASGESSGYIYVEQEEEIPKYEPIEQEQDEPQEESNDQWSESEEFDEDAEEYEEESEQYDEDDNEEEYPGDGSGTEPNEY